MARTDGGRDVFLHAKDIPSDQRRPRLGDKVLFEPQLDARGRVFASKPRLRGAGASWGLMSLLSMGLAAAAYALLVLLRLVPLNRATSLLGLYFFWSPIAFGVYLRDKRLAVAGSRRVPERNLHFLEIVGGWPGALLAQRLLRHKSRKHGYQFVYWSIVFVHCALWLLWVLPAE